MSDNNNYNLNPFPTSAKPIFLRVGLLLVGVICLWFFLHTLDKEQREEEEKQAPKTEAPASPKYKIPQNFGE